jgi:hypothetical protein
MPATWSVRQEDGAASIALEHRGIAIATRFRKVITLREGERDLHVRYEIANEGREPLAVHWKTHPALPLEPGARLHLPARRVLVDEGFAGAFGAEEFAWPDAPLPGGGARDLRVLPDPGTGDMWFLYGLELAAGYCAVSYPASSVGFGMTFDPEVLTSVWIFASFGAWRNLNAIILEPCTGYRARLDDAIAHGSATPLAPGAPIVTEIVMSVLGDAAVVVAFERAGGRRDLITR